MKNAKENRLDYYSSGFLYVTTDKHLKQLEFEVLIKRDGWEITITDTQKLKNYFNE